jgi:hypothetical protein
MSSTLAKRSAIDITPTQSTATAIVDAIEGLKAIRTFVQQEFRKGTDFGRIPGCGDKDVLLLAGAQKASMYFNVRPKFTIERNELGEGHVEFILKCRLISRATREEVGEGVGSASTKEKKFLRSAVASLKKCPTCGKAAVMKSKDKPEYFCWRKKDGCGATFSVRHPDLQGNAEPETEAPYEMRNTVLKMAKKRSHVDAAMTLGCLSELFTQDIDDFYDAEDVRETARPAPEQAPNSDYHVNGEVVEPSPAKPGPKCETNNSGYGRTGIYGSPAQIAEMAAAVAKQYEATRDKWADSWFEANKEFPPGLPEHPVSKPQLMNHLLKQAVAEKRLTDLPEAINPETGERIAKVSTEQTKGLLAVVYARDKKWLLDEVWFYFWQKAAEVSRKFYDESPNWTIPDAFDPQDETEVPGKGDADDSE